MKNTLIYGIHPIEALLNQDPEALQSIVLLEHKPNPRLQKILDLAKKNSIKINFLPKDKFFSLAGNTTHQGILAYIDEKPGWQEQDLLTLFHETSSPLFLFLDGVQDPHNLGACLRSANAAGVTAVVSPKDNAATLNATVRKVACGAEQFTPFIAVTNLARTLRQLKDEGLWLIGLDGAAEQPLYHLDMKGPIGIVLGAESTGIRHLSKTLCDFLAYIPMKGQIESLNVSNACAIALFEAVRQRFY